MCVCVFGCVHKSGNARDHKGQTAFRHFTECGGWWESVEETSMSPGFGTEDNHAVAGECIDPGISKRQYPGMGREAALDLRTPEVLKKLGNCRWGLCKTGSVHEKGKRSCCI